MTPFRFVIPPRPAFKPFRCVAFKCASGARRRSLGEHDPEKRVPVLGKVSQVPKAFRCRGLQPAMGTQNLAVAQAHQVTVGVGASVPLVLPAWCLNPTFSLPHGPMTSHPNNRVALG